MIRAVRCNKPHFREVLFTPGFNVVLADRTKDSSDKDSRNGLGKSTLLEIIHFCLGASSSPNKGLRVPQLENWTFYLDLTLQGKDVTVARNTSDFGVVLLDGDFSDWPVQPEFDEGRKRFVLKIKDWTACLGFLMFHLNPETIKQSYTPTFRSMISYFIRRGTEAFEDAFSHTKNQAPWDIQVNNAFLIGLNWEYASEFQILKDNKKLLDNLKKAAGQGLLSGFAGTLGELESERVVLEEKVHQANNQLDSFKVHPQYEDIQKSANTLTQQIHNLVNEQTNSRRLLEQYLASVEEEKNVPVDSVEQVYKKAGLVFSSEIRKKLNDVVGFHEKVVENRKAYLESEISRLQRLVGEQSAQIQELSDQRADLLTILKTHGALDEHAQLQNRVTDLNAQLKEIEGRIQNWKQFESGLSDYKIKKEALLQKLRQDYNERKVIADKARIFFNQNSEALYEEPGRLNIDFKDSGYQFSVDIKRTKSQGIGYMKVFCYDWMLAQLRANWVDSPGFLIHDSIVFNGVDERQIAKAIELAANVSSDLNYQYILTLNSDQIPQNDFSEGFGDVFEDAVRSVLTDEMDEGGLLGVRF